MHMAFELLLGLNIRFLGQQTTKWLDFGGGGAAGTAWLELRLLSGKAPAVVAAYDVASANDCPERDPCDWVLEGIIEGEVGGRWLLHLPACKLKARVLSQLSQVPLYYICGTCNTLVASVTLVTWLVMSGADGLASSSSPGTPGINLTAAVCGWLDGA